MTTAPATSASRSHGRWTSLLGAGLRLYLSRRIARLSDAAYWTRRTHHIQLRTLRSLLRRAADTDFGRRHSFSRLSRLADAELIPAYRREVPIADWYAFKDLIARMREGGEPDVLWPGRVLDYAQTSGTTAGDKFIPVSREMLRSNFRASADIFAHLARFGVSLPFITGGRVLFLGGSTDLTTNAVGSRTGDLSGVVAPLIRWPTTAVYSPGKAIALMSHWPSKIEAMAQAAIDQDIRMVLGMPSWATVLFDRVLLLWVARRSAAALKGNSADPAPPLRSRGFKQEEPPRSGGLPQDPTRSGGPPVGVRDLWPNLRVFVHGGVKYAPFESRVRQLYSGDPAGDDFPTRLELYPASEAFIAIQDTPGDPGLRLNADLGNFFEFVPLERIADPDPPAFTADAVDKGQRYVVVVTSCAGLWRYILGDVVVFDTVPAGPTGRGGDGPARLRIVGRHRHFINAFGENLIVEHIENAVAAAASATGLVVGEFTAAPVYPDADQRAGVELAVEIERKPGGATLRVASSPDSFAPLAPTPDILARFRDAFDASLKAQSVDYGVKRTDNLSMTHPTITPLPPGSFHKWMASRGKLGGQHKCPRCANGREIIDAVKQASGR